MTDISHLSVAQSSLAMPEQYRYGHGTIRVAWPCDYHGCNECDAKTSVCCP